MAIRELLANLTRELILPAGNWELSEPSHLATQKDRKDVSPYQSQAWLSHENLNTTRLYAHPNRQYAQKVMEAASL